MRNGSNERSGGGKEGEEKRGGEKATERARDRVREKEMDIRKRR